MARNKSDYVRDQAGYEYGGIAFIGATAIGVGIGILNSQALAGLLIGAGAGFIIMAFIAAGHHHHYDHRR